MPEEEIQPHLDLGWERALWHAVLVQAIRDVVSGPEEFESGLSEEDCRRAAQHWVNDSKDEPRRFLWVCDHLDLEPNAVRRQIAERENDDT